MNGQFDLGAISPVRYFFGIAAVLGLLLGFTTGDDESPTLWARLLQWQLQAVGIMGCLVLSHVLLLRGRWFERRGPWLQLLVSGAIGSALFAPAGVAIDHWIGGDAVLPGQWPLETLDEFAGIAPPAMLCWAAINAPWILGFRVERRPFQDNATKAGTEAAPGEQPRREPAFLELLPEQLRGDVIYLQAELHYISVTTTRGRALVLYNLRDAIDELESVGVAGFQSHRSYWVAAAFTSGFRRRGRQGEIEMSNGDIVPVSRRNVDEIGARLGA